MRDAPGGDGIDDSPPAAADATAEAVLDMPCEAAAAGAVEQLVADPVRLDDPGVERIVDAVRAGDQRQVRPGAIEGAGELGEPSVRGAGGAVLEQRARLVGAAQPERVRGVCVAREQERAGGHVAPRRRGARRAATAASAAPITIRPIPIGSTGTPSAARARNAVTTAPHTSTAVTSTACARASASYHVATYAVRSAPVKIAQPHCTAPRPARSAQRPETPTHARRIAAPKVIRATASVRGSSPATNRLTRITSTDHSSVAARIIASPLPNANVPTPPTSQACPATRRALAPTRAAPRPSPSRG